MHYYCVIIMLMKKDETIENYLEAIYFISKEKKVVRAIDVVNYLGFSRPTVSVALKNLEKDGYIQIDNNVITLAKKGIEVAKTISERHEYIANILIKLGVSEQTAYNDSCLIEHDISDETFEAIKKATKNI